MQIPRNEFAREFQGTL